MATATTNQPSISKNETAGQQQQQGIGSPITNDAYDVITALQSKLEGLEAYRKYAKDGRGGLWQKLSQHEQESVSLLVDELECLVKEGKFRMREPGRGNS